MTPIERAARALWDLHPLTEDGVTIPWERVDAGIKADLAQEVRAVLTEIREPSEAMIAAAAECDSSYVGDVYTAMIEAMLEEG